ncbi:MAG: hypothetical protein GY792_21405, partial [Gammaproteobacteria bacterium]|nr:hypothetical protein [Gammaproteobacteria bacterium]
MKTMHLDISAPRIVLTRLLGRLTQAAYFAPTSPLHLTEIPDPTLPA